MWHKVHGSFKPLAVLPNATSFNVPNSLFLIELSKVFSRLLFNVADNGLLHIFPSSAK